MSPTAVSQVSENGQDKAISNCKTHVKTGSEPQLSTYLQMKSAAVRDSWN